MDGSMEPTMEPRRRVVLSSSEGSRGSRFLPLTCAIPFEGPEAAGLSQPLRSQEPGETP